MREGRKYDVFSRNRNWREEEEEEEGPFISRERPVNELPLFSSLLFLRFSQMSRSPPLVAPCFALNKRERVQDPALSFCPSSAPVPAAHAHAQGIVPVVVLDPFDPLQAAALPGHLCSSVPSVRRIEPHAAAANLLRGP